MKSNTQNAKIEAITEKTLVLGIDVGSEMHYARAFDYRGIEYSKKPFKFSNTEAGFVTFKEWILDLKERHEKGNKPETFDFLGFTHYCSKSRNGNFRVKHKTANKKYRKKCKQMNITIRDMRFEKKKYILAKVNQILIGYYHYYGISDNYQMMDNFRKRVIQILYFWMNRRSQRKSYTWDGFNQFLKEHPIVRPRIYVSLYG